MNFLLVRDVSDFFLSLTDLCLSLTGIYITFETIQEGHSKSAYLALTSKTKQLENSIFKSFIVLLFECQYPNFTVSYRAKSDISKYHNKNHNKKVGRNTYISPCRNASIFLEEQPSSQGQIFHFFFKQWMQFWSSECFSCRLSCTIIKARYYYIACVCVCVCIILFLMNFLHKSINLEKNNLYPNLTKSQI